MGAACAAPIRFDTAYRRWNILRRTTSKPDRFREEAQATRDPEIRARLLNIANQYDPLAELVKAKGKAPT